MNATFNLTDPTLAEAFDGLCKLQVLADLKGIVP